jgi:hypothetical protein
LLGQLIGTDPALAYRYLKLNRLGAAPRYSVGLDKKLAEEAQLLSPSQMDDANEWAQDTYSRYFTDSPDETAKGLRTCVGSDEP